MTEPIPDRPHPDWDRAGADWPNRSASRFPLVDGVSWHLQRLGEAGPALLLIHGAGATTHSWRDLMPILAERHDVLAPDLPRHGFTRTPGGGRQSLPAMAGALAALLDRLEIAPDVVVGHSAGTAIALRMALDGRIAPSRIIGLNAALAPFRGLAGVLFPPAARLLAFNPLTPRLFASLAGRGRSARQLIEGTGSRIDETGLALYTRLFGRTDHVAGALAMMANWDLSDLLHDLARLETPLDLIVGLEDKAVNPEEARHLAAKHAPIQLHEVPGAGHLLHEERPAETAQMIERLISGP